VTYNESAGLHVTDPEAGRELSPPSVDDDIICTRSIGRICQFEYAVYEDTNVSANPGEYTDYQFVYLNETLYRPTTIVHERQLQMSLDRVTESDPLRDVATRGRISEGARSAISSGSVLTYHELPEDGTLVRHDGQYYTLYAAGVIQYGIGGSSCASSGDGFCVAADTKRWTDSLLTLVSWGIGVALVVFAFRSRDPT
jgi:hypothetical protein